jgi:hypothetical protein
MSTRSAVPPVEQSYLLRAWLVVVGVVLVAAMAIALALATTGSEPAGGTDPGAVTDYGPVKVWHTPFIVNGSVCGQCR